ncbi:hypothetical protein NDU88_004935 [Pleurodeles waltl]|uniref:Uncharacterized protein n=1 Tax=Pleurodeles waltl TaxID=8319 RepID=A0AAV7VLR5_PLEWA|nr:hypothetical protein NDU88_004935 [Pleurodeles waltl]
MSHPGALVSRGHTIRGSAEAAALICGIKGPVPWNKNKTTLPRSRHPRCSQGDLRGGGGGHGETVPLQLKSATGGPALPMRGSTRLQAFHSLHTLRVITGVASPHIKRRLAQLALTPSALPLPPQTADPAAGLTSDETPLLSHRDKYSKITQCEVYVPSVRRDQMLTPSTRTSAPAGKPASSPHWVPRRALHLSTAPIQLWKSQAGSAPAYTR